MVSDRLLQFLLLTLNFLTFFLYLQRAQLVFCFLKNVFSPSQVLTGYISLHCPKLSATVFWRIYQIICFISWESSKLMVKKILAFSNSSCTGGHILRCHMHILVCQLVCNVFQIFLGKSITVTQIIFITSELLHAWPEPDREEGFCPYVAGQERKMPFFPTPPAIQCLEEKQERNHGDLSELREAAASSAGVVLLMDSCTYCWKKPLSLSRSSSPLSFLPYFWHLLSLNYTNGRARENFQKPQESTCY